MRVEPERVARRRRRDRRAAQRSELRNVDLHRRAPPLPRRASGARDSRSAGRRRRPVPARARAPRAPHAAWARRAAAASRRRAPRPGREAEPRPGPRAGVPSPKPPPARARWVLLTERSRLRRRGDRLLVTGGSVGPPATAARRTPARTEVRYGRGVRRGRDLRDVSAHLGREGHANRGNRRAERRRGAFG